jgi:hypothetical protein
MLLASTKPHILSSVKQLALHTTINHNDLASYVAGHRGGCQNQDLVCNVQCGSELLEWSPRDQKLLSTSYTLVEKQGAHVASEL